MRACLMHVRFLKSLSPTVTAQVGGVIVEGALIGFLWPAGSDRERQYSLRRWRPLCAPIAPSREDYRFAFRGIIEMIESDNLELSVAAALPVNEREVDHLIKLKQLSRS